MQDGNNYANKKKTRQLLVTTTLSIFLAVTLVFSAFSAGSFVQSAWALPYVSSVSASPSSAEKVKGDTATYTVTVTRASGTGSGTVNLSLQSGSIPSSAAHFETSDGTTTTSVNFGNGGPNSKSVNLKIDTSDLSTGDHTFTVKGTKSNAATDSATSSSTALKVTAPPNQDPVADAGEDQTVNEGDSVSLDGSESSDPDGDTLAYSWSQTAGQDVELQDSNTDSPSFTAPDVDSDGDTLTFELTVDDGEGGVDTDSVDIVVNNVVTNQPPEADAGSDQTVNEGDNVNLDGSGSSDPDGDSLTFSWTQTGGDEVTLEGADTATPSFTAPNIGASGATLTFELTVDDGNGETDTDGVDILVENSNAAPTADAGEDQTVTEGDSVGLDGSQSSDSDGTVESYSWTQTGGDNTVELSDANSAAPSFTAPSVGSAGDALEFELTATDNDGGTGTDSVTITVNNANENPIADAGEDQTVYEGDNVGLDGSGSSDSDDGTIASYAWSQTAGTEVTLDDASSATPSFAAPNVDSDGATLTFELQVTDNDGATDTDTVDITVQNLNQPPTADAGSDKAVDEGSTSVQLDGSVSSDADGSIVSYSWEQTDGPSVTLTNADSSTATFDAPQVASNTELTFKLTVTDNDGASDDDTIVVTINNVNQPPEASLTATPDSIEEGSTSTLDASGSTDDGGIVEYVFEQTGGTSGTITVDTSDPSKATFEAPAISADETSSIKVTVKDAEGATESAVVEIVVTNAAPHATTLTLNTITSVPWGKDVTVTGKLSDNDASGAGVGGATISFDGTGAENLPDVVTNADGTFTAKGASLNTVATGWKVQAHFAGNSDYKASDSIVKSYSSTKHSVFIAITFKSSTGSATATPWSTATTFTVTLTDTTMGGTVISGKTIRLDGTGVTSVADLITGTDGKATGTGTSPNSVATGWTYQAHFAGDSLYYAKDSAIKTYSTAKHSVTLSLSTPTTAVAPGSSYKVSGTLTDSTAKVPLASKTITFTADAPIAIVDKSTNTNGYYSSTQAAPTTPGTYNIQSHFAGDSLYNAKNSVSKTLTVQ